MYLRLKTIIVSGILLILLSAPGRAHAQRVTYDGCRDINNFYVASILNNAISDVAMATLLNGNPVIYYNTATLSWVRPPTRLFFYAHECGHHALGHVLRSHSQDDEQEADCWGISKLKELGRLSDVDINTIQQDISRFGRTDEAHLPGPERARKLRGCLTDDSPAPVESPRPTGHWEVKACVHPAHPNGDVGPCQHVCGFAYGRALPCHPAGDLYPCQHPAHPNGHREWVPD